MQLSLGTLKLRRTTRLQTMVQHLFGHLLRLRRPGPRHSRMLAVVAILALSALVAFAPRLAAAVKTLTVSAGSSNQNFAFTPTPGQGGNQAFVQEGLTFTAAPNTTSMRIRFASRTSGSYGPQLDDVSVSDITGPAPARRPVR